MFSMYSKSKHTGKITRKYVYMHEPNSLDNSLKHVKEFEEILKYPCTDQIQLTFTNHLHLVGARHCMRYLCKHHHIMCLLRRSPLYL